MIEAYKIGIRVALINHVSTGLGHIIGHFSQTQKHADELHKKLKEIKLLGLTGAAVGAGGFMGLGMVAKTIKPASEYVHQLVMMNNEGMKHLDIVKATQAAWDATKVVPTSSVMDNLSTIRELKMVTGNVAHAIEYMPTLQKVQGILGTVRHGEHSAKSESYELAKALEMKGSVKTPEQFVGAADLMTKAIVAAGGKISATDFLSAFKYGRAATAAWGDDFTYKILPTLVQEMKGGGSGGASGGPGSALMSMYSAVVGGSVTQRSIKVWQELGLLDPSKIVWTKDGHAKGVAPGGVMGGSMFQQNPYEWVSKILVPALQAHGYGSEDKMRQALQYMFPNRTAGFIATQFALQGWKFDRDRKLIDQAKGIGGYEELVKTDPMMAQVALQKQWNSLLAILGYQIMPPLISGMQTLIGVTTSVSKWISEHGRTAKVAMWAFIGLSSALAISGTIMMVTAAVGALQLVLPLLAGGGGIAGLTATLIGPGGLVLAAGAAVVGLGLLVKWLWDKTDPAKVKAEAKDYHGWDFGSAGAGYQHKSIFSTGDGIATGKNGKTVAVTTKINLDGRQVASVVSKHQANEAERPQLGMKGFDVLLSPMPVGY